MIKYKLLHVDSKSIYLIYRFVSKLRSFKYFKKSLFQILHTSCKN